MNQTIWELARQSKMMGVETTTVLKPTHITVRVKNSIKRMLNNCGTQGYGNAAQIARLLMRHFNLPSFSHTESYLNLRAKNVDPSVVDELIEIFKADFTCRMLDEQHPTSIKYLREDHEQNMEYMECLRNGTASEVDKYLHMQNADYRNKALSVLTSLVSQEDKERIKHVITLLDREDPIHIASHQAH